MKFSCISAEPTANDQIENDEIGSNGEKSRKNRASTATKTMTFRQWIHSFRRGFKRDQRHRKEPRIEISKPMHVETLTHNTVIRMNGNGCHNRDDDDDADDDEPTNISEINTHSDGDDRNSNNGEHNVAKKNFDQITNGDCSIRRVDTTVERTASPPLDDQIDVTDSSKPPQSQPQQSKQNEIVQNSVIESPEQIVSYAWFWGNITRREAETLLRGQPDGSFLVRKSSDSHFLYSLSFRSNGKTMHTRIEYVNGMFFFFSNESISSRRREGNSTLGGLIAVAMNRNNADNIFFYSRGLRSETSLHTVFLDQPISRQRCLLEYDYDGDERKTLQYMCKFVLHHCPRARANLDAQFDSLPDAIRSFAHNSFYFPRKTPIV